jgi:hypothetical protein
LFGIATRYVEAKSKAYLQQAGPTFHITFEFGKQNFLRFSKAITNNIFRFSKAKHTKKQVYCDYKLSTGSVFNEKKCSISALQEVLYLVFSVKIAE